jgi:hypothetical protein
MNATLRWVVCGLLALAPSTGAGATEVEVQFEGIVVLGLGEIGFGAPLQGRIVYDNTVVGFPGPSGTLHDAISTFDFSLGGFAYTLNGPVGRVLVENDSGVPATDNIGYSSIPSGLSGPAMMGSEPDDVFLLLSGGATTLWPSTSLSDVPTSYSLSDFTGQLFFLSFGDGAVIATLTSLVAAPLGGGGDSDGDGIPDAEDDCPSSDLSATVVIDACDSEVANTLLPTGCTISDLVSEAAAAASNHGAFVANVVELTMSLVDDGVLTAEDAAMIVSCAGMAGP